MLNKAIFTLLFILSFLLTYSQSTVVSKGFTTHSDGLESCGKASVHEQKMASDPVYRYATERAEEQIYQTLLRQQKNGSQLKNNDACVEGAIDNSGVLTIPVVVHVLHPEGVTPGNSSANPGDAQIITGMEHLNDAFRNRGVYSDDGRAAKDGDNPDRELMKSQDIKIEFCLAKRDINGNETNGILRYETDTYSDLNSNRDNEMKNWVRSRNNRAFPTAFYLNIYLVNVICDGSTTNLANCRTLGYAYLAGAHGTSFDGIVNMARYFGTRTDLSKVHVHEVGHYLNLDHTFSGECGGNDCLRSGDRVCDTPPDNSTVRVDCDTRQNSCDNDTAGDFFTIDHEDMYENYMDYASFQCQNTFTQGQKDRMRAALLGVRSSLLESNGCIPVGSSAVVISDISSPKGISCNNRLTPSIEVENKGDDIVRSLRIQYEFDNNAPRFYNWQGNIARGAKATINLPQLNLNTAGRYGFSVQLLEANGEGVDATIGSACQPFQYAPAISELPFCESIPTEDIPIEFAINNEDNGVGFEAVEVSACETKQYALALETWSQFPDRTTKDEIFTQAIDLSAYDAAYFEFDLAHAYTFPNYNTILDISVSDNCGFTYQTVYQKTGEQLATTEVEASNSRDESAFFIPTDCNQWRKEVINLSAFAGRKINIRIQASTANLTNSINYEWGNNLYLDNLCLSSERCSAPVTQVERQVSICNELTLEADANISGDNAVFWWITSNNPITTIINNQQFFESAIGFTPKGDENGLTGQGNIIFQSNAGQGKLNIPVDCDRMNSDQNYYAIPFVVNRDFTNPFFNDCTFGQAVEFSCDCTNACTLDISNIQVQNTSSCDLNNGAFTIFSSETENVEYSINNVNWQQSNRFFELAAGQYEVYIRSLEDASCLATSTININEPDRPSIKSIVVSSPSNCNTKNGSIDIVSDGSEIIEFRLNGGAWQNTSVFNNLAAGEYIIEVRDRPGSTCITTRTVTVSEASAVRITNVNANNPRWCGSADGSISIDLQNPSNQIVEYSIDGQNWQTSNTFSDLKAGEYEVNIRLQSDINCGNDSRMITLQEGTDNGLQDIVLSNPTDCGVNDGRIEILLQSEDIRPVQFSINGGENWQTNNIFDNLSPATYTVQIRNANQFSCLTERIVTLVSPPNNDINIQDIQIAVPTACGVNDGSVIILTNNIEGAEYSIDGGESWQATNEFLNLSGGVYLPQVRSGLCSFAEGERIELTPRPTGIDARLQSLNNPVCLNEENGFSVSITGGVAPYTIRYRIGQEIFTLENYNDQETFFFTPVSLVSQIRLLSIEDAESCRVDSEKSILVYAFRCGGRNNYELATEFKLYPNQPNPFSTSTSIRFDLPQTEQVVLNIYEVTGKLVQRLERDFGAGYQEWVLDAKELPASGVLYYTIETSEERKTGKMVRIE